MKVTKYEHACFTVEQDGRLLVVDPGNFTKAFEIPENITAIVITHEHQDHFDPDVLAALFSKNPDAVLFSLAPIVDAIPGHDSRKVVPTDKVAIGPFQLEFFGDKHAQIHADIPLIDNIGVMINDTLYYPGDSFYLPNLPVKLLALPASGPWFKTSDAIDFLTAVKPTKAFATHNIHNSEPGQLLFNRIVSGFAEKVGTTYISLDVKQTIDA